MSPLDNNILYASERGHYPCQAGIYRSNDHGHTWTLIGLEGKELLWPIAIGVDSQGNEILYVNHIGTNSGMYMTDDGGNSWSYSRQGCDFLTVDPVSPTKVYCGITNENKLRVTTDGGRSWQWVATLESVRITAVHIDYYTGMSRIIVGGSGINISMDGGASWMERSNGLGSLRTLLTIDPTDSNKMYVGAYGVQGCGLYRSTDQGGNWRSIVSPEYGNWCGPVFDKDLNLYAVRSGNIVRSGDGGDTWVRTNQPFWTNSPAEGIQWAAANPYIAGHIYAMLSTPPYLYYSTDSGNSWQPNGDIKNFSWSTRLFFQEGGSRVYAITGGGSQYSYFSDDAGKTWKTCGSYNISSDFDTRLVINPLDPQHILQASIGNGIYSSTDGCQSWSNTSRGLGNLFVNTVAIDPNNPDTIYAGTNGGAYVSFNGGQSWNQINEGLLGATVVYSIVVDSESNVYAATPYGIFKLEGK